MEVLGRSETQAGGNPPQESQAARVSLRVLAPASARECVKGSSNKTVLQNVSLIRAMAQGGLLRGAQLRKPPSKRTNELLVAVQSLQLS